MKPILFKRSYLRYRASFLFLLHVLKMEALSPRKLYPQQLIRHPSRNHQKSQPRRQHPNQAQPQEIRLLQSRLLNPQEPNHRFLSTNLVYHHKFYRSEEGTSLPRISIPHLLSRTRTLVSDFTILTVLSALTPMRDYQFTNR